MDDSLFYTPYLKSDVVLTSERKRHILLRHSDLGSMQDIEQMIQETLLAPAIVQRSATDIHGLVFARWHPQLHKGKFLLVMVIADPERNWIITAYSSNEVPEGEILWQEG